MPEASFAGVAIPAGQREPIEGDETDPAVAERSLVLTEDKAQLDCSSVTSASEREERRDSTPVLLTRSDASKPYSAFSEIEKWFIIVASATAAIFSSVCSLYPLSRTRVAHRDPRPISSNIYVPAIPTLAKDFDRSNQDITLTVTIYLYVSLVTVSSMSMNGGSLPQQHFSSLDALGMGFSRR